MCKVSSILVSFYEMKSKLLQMEDKYYGQIVHFFWIIKQLIFPSTLLASLHQVALTIQVNNFCIIVFSLHFSLQIKFLSTIDYPKPVLLVFFYFYLSRSSFTNDSVTKYCRRENSTQGYKLHSVVL